MTVTAAAVMRPSHGAVRVTAAPAAALRSLSREVRDTLTSKDKNKSLSTHPPISIKNNTITATRQIKYLGVHIDESLSFSHHATMAAANGNQALGSLNFLRHHSCGISAQVAHHLVMTAILPTMSWASPA